MMTSIRSKAAPILFGIVAAALVGTLGACAVVVFAIAPLLAATDLACGDGPEAARRPDRLPRQGDVVPIGTDIAEWRLRRR